MALSTAPEMDVCVWSCPVVTYLVSLYRECRMYGGPSRQGDYHVAAGYNTEPLIGRDVLVPTPHVLQCSTV